MSCGKCKDGWLVDAEGTYYRCDCYEAELAKLRIKKSGISEEFRKKGFTDFDDRGNEQLKIAKSAAINYTKNFLETEHSRNNSIMFCGQVGSGKTHLSMAIANNLMNKMNVGVIYMPYRDTATVIKQSITDKDNYQNAINKYQTARVLFIDDLLKGKSTDSDLNILFEIINYRYLNNLPLIISTEKSVDDLLDFDEGVMSRIIQMCKGNIITFSGRELNYRIYG